jgi:phage terminase small subunit
VDEALIEMARAEGCFAQSHRHPDIPAKSEAVRHLVELGLKPKSKA